MNCWHILGIAPTGDEAAIKTAYAALVRVHRPDRDPAGFRRIRAAYEEALRLRPHYEHRSDGSRRPSTAPDGHDTAPNNPPAPAAAQPYPPAAPAYTHANPPATATPDGFTFTLTEPAAHGYRDTPPTATEQPFPLAEPAAHDYQDSSARPALTPLNATLLLLQLQQAWQGLDDAALLAILQAQATHPALDNIDFRLDYLSVLYDHLVDGFYLRCLLWAQQYYELPDLEDELLLDDYITICRRQWEEAINDSELCRILQEQAADPVLAEAAVYHAWLAALVAYLGDSLARPRSYYWARSRYPSAFPDTIPPTYRDYPDERVAAFARTLMQTADDAALTALLEDQAADTILAYPPARAQYLARLAELRPDWYDRPAANRWLEAHYTLPHINSAARQQALLSHLQQEWQGKNDERLLAILQAQATRPSLEHIDLRGDYTAALQAHLMQQHLPHSTLWADAHYQLGRHDPAWQRQRQLACITVGDRAGFVASLDDAYPDLAAWLGMKPLRRYASLWRDWAATRVHPACRDEWQLRASLRPAIEGGPLSYAPPRDHRKLWIFIGIIAAIVFAITISIMDNGVPTTATNARTDFSYAPPTGYGIPWLFLILLRFFGEFRLRRINPDHILNRFCPPLRTLHDYYRPCPHLLRWLMTDLAIILTLCLITDQYPQTRHTTLTLGTLWLTGRVAQTLWQCKRAIAAGWHPPQAAIYNLLAWLYPVGLLWCLTSPYWLPADTLSPDEQTFILLLTTLLSIAFTASYWLRIPPGESAPRRALFDNGCLAVLVSITFFTAYREPASDLIALLICPLTALSTVYCYRPLPLGARATRIISHLLGSLLITPLYLAGSLTLMLLALPDSMLGLPLIRSAAVGLPLAVAACKHPQIPPAALMVPFYYLARALLYLFTAQAATLIAVALVGITGSALPTAAFLALVVLHILAAWKAA